MDREKGGESTLTPPSPATTAGEEQEEQGARLVTVLYSLSKDLYRIPSIEKVCWLSVKVYPLPQSTLRRDDIYLGASITADGQGWRKAYAIRWRAIVQGDCVTIPVDDPMVKDYQAFEVQPLRPEIDPL
jgi:hypothetical protein